MQIFETIGTEHVNLTGKQIDEIVDLISKEEYLENEEKIEKALAKSKEIRAKQDRQPIEQSTKKADTITEKEPATRSDDEKHVLNAELTPEFDEELTKKITDMNVIEKSKTSSSPTKPSI